MTETDDKKSVLTRVWPYKRRIAQLFVGQAANQTTIWTFDYFLYPFIIYKFGILMGGAVMTALSFGICVVTMKFYDWSKRDWLGIEAIKSLKDYDGVRQTGKFSAWVLKKSDPIAFLFLSLKFDPFITTVYLRHGQYSGMNRRDWTIFTASVLFGNAYWTLACYMGISLFEWVWKAVVG